MEGAKLTAMEEDKKSSQILIKHRSVDIYKKNQPLKGLSRRGYKTKDWKRKIFL